MQKEWSADDASASHSVSFFHLLQNLCQLVSDVYGQVLHAFVPPLAMLDYAAQMLVDVMHDRERLHCVDGAGVLISLFR
jgi:hypothetical protein